MENDGFSVPMVPKIKLFSTEEIAAQRAPEGAPAPETPKESPLETLHKFSPTIADRIVSFWGKPDLAVYLNSITLMDREGRAGFPADVMRALMAILQSTKDPIQKESPWEGSPGLEKAFKKNEQEIRRSRMGSRISANDAAILDTAALKKSTPFKR